MVSDPTKPKQKNITVNRLPADVVIGFKALASRMDCKIEDLMQCVLEDALRKGDEWWPNVLRLQKAKAKAKQDQKRVDEQLKQIKERLAETNE